MDLIEAIPGLEVIGRAQFDVEGITDGGGEYVTTLPPVGAGELLLLQRLVITSTAAVDHGFHMYRDAMENRKLIDASGIGRLDSADYDGNVIVDQGERIIMRWFGTGGANVACTASLTAIRARIGRRRT